MLSMTAEMTPRSQQRLDSKDYERLRLKVLERDGWKCQQCGSREQLHVHHIVHRSQCGADCEENLITLCSDCHKAAHSRRSHQIDIL
jgi:5-methylcytosine-specific restriction endonuclease McrA